MAYTFKLYKDLEREKETDNINLEDASRSYMFKNIVDWANNLKTNIESINIKNVNKRLNELETRVKQLNTKEAEINNEKIAAIKNLVIDRGDIFLDGIENVSEILDTMNENLQTFMSRIKANLEPKNDGTIPGLLDRIKTIKTFEGNGQFTFIKNKRFKTNKYNLETVFYDVNKIGNASIMLMVTDADVGKIFDGLFGSSTPIYTIPVNAHDVCRLLKVNSTATISKKDAEKFLDITKKMLNNAVLQELVVSESKIVKVFKTMGSLFRNDSTSRGFTRFYGFYTLTYQKLLEKTGASIVHTVDALEQFVNTCESKLK